MAACARGRAAARAALLGGAVLLATVPAAAQETRAEVIRLAQEEKQQAIEPPRPNAVERTIDRLEDWGLIAGAPRGFYPWVGSVYPGGGFALGAGARAPFADDGALNVFGGYSIGGFGRAQADLALPTFARRLVRIGLTGQYIDAPDVRFFGVGNESSRADASRFGYSPRGAGVRLDVGAGEVVRVAGGVSYLRLDLSGGKTDPSIEQLFVPSAAPGLGVSSLGYVHGMAEAALDWRKPLGYSGEGGLYRVRFDEYRARDGAPYSFRSVEAEIAQLIPILRANWVVALHGLATTTDAGSAEAVPFFLLPALGGGTTLRGYPDFRFRDRHRLLMNAELRWTPARILDMAIFYDTGKVAARRSDLGLKDLHDSYGIGMRLIGLTAYAFRIEVARSREHAARLLVSAGGAF